MAHHDFREYLHKLEQADELCHVRPEVDPHLELAAISQRLNERGGPTVQFHNVKGAKNGVSYVGGSMGRGMGGLWSKLAVALEIDPAQRYVDMLENLHRRSETPIRPIQITEGPVKENLRGGNEVDLSDLAAPTLHEGDGGACLSTWAVTMSQEPGGGFVSWDVIPLIVASNNTLCGHLPRGSNIRRIYDMHMAADQDMPFAVVFGAQPAVPLVAAFKLRREGFVASEIAGALQRQPLQLVQCETSDLLVPATAEMVIEGVIKPGETVEFGPFSSSFGYRFEGLRRGPVFTVTAISHRDDPILPVCPWGTPTGEIHVARGLDSDLQLKAEFERRGAPVTGVFTPPWLAGAVVAVKTKVPYSAYSQAIGGIVRAREATKDVPYVLVCDDDIDLTNPVSLFHALVTKCHPSRDTWVTKASTAPEDAPYLTEAERAAGQGPSMILDCTWPLDWDRSIAVPPKVSFDQCYPKELQEKVLKQWSQELGFPNEEGRPI